MSLSGRRVGHPAEKVVGAKRRPRRGHPGITRADTIMGKLSLTPKRTVSPAETMSRGLAERCAIRELFHHNRHYLALPSRRRLMIVAAEKSGRNGNRLAPRAGIWAEADPVDDQAATTWPDPTLS